MAEPDVPAPVPTESSAAALRVTFAYRGTDIKVAGTRRVRMIVPPSTSPPPEPGQSGYWLEVRAADGRLLFHRALHSPVRVDVEVFAHDNGPSIARVPVPAPQGEFEALLPDLPDADSLALFGPSADAQLQAAPARELIRVDFDALRKLPPETPTPGQGRPGGNRGRR